MALTGTPLPLLVERLNQLRCEADHTFHLVPKIQMLGLYFNSPYATMTFTGTPLPLLVERLSQLRCEADHTFHLVPKIRMLGLYFNSPYATMALTGTPLPLLVERLSLIQLFFVLTLLIRCSVFVCFYLHLSLPFQPMICITYYIQSVNEVTTVSLDDKVFKTELPPWVST